MFVDTVRRKVKHFERAEVASLCYTAQRNARGGTGPSIGTSDFAVLSGFSEHLSDRRDRLSHVCIHIQRLHEPDMHIPTSESLKAACWPPSLTTLQRHILFTDFVVLQERNVYELVTCRLVLQPGVIDLKTDALVCTNLGGVLWYSTRAVGTVRY